MEALRDPKTEAQPKERLALVATPLLGTLLRSVTITGGISLGTPSDDGHDCNTPSQEIASLVQRMVDMQCSVGQ